MYTDVLHKLIYSFSKHLQNTMYVPGTRLNEGGNLVFTFKKLVYWKSYPRSNWNCAKWTSITMKQAQVFTIVLGAMGSL